MLTGDDDEAKAGHDVVGSTFHFPAFWFSGQRSTRRKQREDGQKRRFRKGKTLTDDSGQVINLGADKRRGFDALESFLFYLLSGQEGRKVGELEGEQGGWKNMQVSGKEVKATGSAAGPVKKRREPTCSLESFFNAVPEQTLCVWSPVVVQQ